MTASLAWYSDSSRRLTSGRRHDLFPAGRQDDGTAYRRIELRNAGPSPWTGGVAWIVTDPAGADYAIAVASASAYASEASWPSVTDSALTYATPASSASGLTLPDLAAGQKALLVVRRSLAGAGVVAAETNRLRVAGQSPL